MKAQTEELLLICACLLLPTFECCQLYFQGVPNQSHFSFSVSTLDQGTHTFCLD